MGNLYENIISLCNERGVTAAEMCRGANVASNTMTELKSGRHTGLSAVKAQKIAAYFGVSVGYLLGEENKNAPTGGEDVLQELKDDERALLHSYRTMTDEQRKMMQVFLKGFKSDAGE